VGAGTGAIIGSVISGGDIGASALLGGAIGLPVGLAAGMIYDYYSEKTIREIKIEDIKNNQREILARQREIDALREEIKSDIPDGNPPTDRQQYRYVGPSLGNPYR
jgi:H+/gluconate symporter-like permease